MTGCFIIKVAAFWAATFLLHPDTVGGEFVREQNGKMHEIARAVAKARSVSSNSRRLAPYGSSPSQESQERMYTMELDRLAEANDLMWRGDQIAVQVTSSRGEPDAATVLNSALMEIDGFDVTDCRSYQCSGWMDINILEDVESLPDVQCIVASIRPDCSGSFTGSGTVRSQAIAATQINKVVQKYPELTGAGIKIGIISDSFNTGTNANGKVVVQNTEEDDIESGNLPGGDNKVIVLDDNPFIATDDEGRAMAQLIFDLVPEAQMVFTTGFLPENNFAAAIEALVDAGCDVIVDDVRSEMEPIFQLGFSAQAANTAAEDFGIPYFTVARNLAAQSWEGRGYEDMPCPSSFYDNVQDDYLSCNDFGGGNSKQRIEVGSSGTFSFFWDEPWQSVSGPPGPQTDLDIFLFDAETGQLLVAGGQINEGADAFEHFKVPNAGTYDVVIARFSGPSPSLIKWIFRGNLISSDPPADTATVTSTGNAPSTAAVGAASDQQTFSQLLLEEGSSLGGIPLIFDKEGNRFPQELVLNQPRFVGPDGSYTTFFSKMGLGLTRTQKSETTPPRFYGTSCSCTNIAAVAVIVLQAFSLFKGENQRFVKGRKTPRKNLETADVEVIADDIDNDNDIILPHDIYKIMEETAIDMNEPGFDFLTGYGFVNALAAVEAVIGRATTSKPTKSPSTNPTKSPSTNPTKAPKRSKAPKSTKSPKKTKLGEETDKAEMPPMISSMTSGTMSSTMPSIGDEGECPAENFLDPIESYFTTFTL